MVCEEQETYLFVAIRYGLTRASNFNIGTHTEAHYIIIYRKQAYKYNAKQYKK